MSLPSGVQFHSFPVVCVEKRRNVDFYNSPTLNKHRAKTLLAHNTRRSHKVQDEYIAAAAAALLLFQTPRSLSDIQTKFIISSGVRPVSQIQARGHTQMGPPGLRFFSKRRNTFKRKVSK